MGGNESRGFSVQGAKTMHLTDKGSSLEMMERSIYIYEHAGSYVLNMVITYAF